MRRMRTLAAAVVALAALGAGVAPTSSFSAPLPTTNFLVIVTDDQRAGPLIRMPETREIFGEGIEFTNAYATTPLCCPSRASIFTGRYAHNHGVKYFNPSRLDQSTTLQSYLQDGGYSTAIYGKYLNNWDVRADPPNFDDWATFPQSNPETYVGGQWNVDGTVHEIDMYSTDFIAEQAIEYLDETEVVDPRPWLMFLSPPAPHEPYTPQEQYAHAKVPSWRGNPGVFEKNLKDKPPYLKELYRRCGFKCGTDIRERQIRTLMSVDDLIGTIFGKLDELGETDSTLAVYISDNGLLWGEHRMNEKRPPYTQSIQVPLYLRWPGVVDPREDDRIAANIDIAPTLLEVAGIEQRDDVPMDGRSLLSARTRRQLLLEHWQANLIPTWASIRTDDFQYVAYFDQHTNLDFREYYDLENDPHQLTNLLRDRDDTTGPSRDHLRKLHTRLRSYRRCAGADCP